MLLICRNTLADDTIYQELGADYLTGKDQPEPRRKHLVAQLEELGHHVELAPVA